MTKTKVNKDGSIELGSDFVDAFEKERDRQVSEMDAMFADPLFRGMATRMGIDMTEMDKVHEDMKKKMGK